VVVVDGETGMTSPSHVYMQLLTGPDGSWTSGEIAPDTYDLEVTASGYVPVRTSVVVGEGVSSTRRNFALIASQPFTVRGTVRNQSGAPLFGVAVILIDDGGGLRLSTTTASDGTYGFTHDPGVYTGGYTLFAELAGHTPFQLRIPTISNGATVLQYLTLAALGVLTGLINDANSAVPVAGARVSAGAEAATSDATGWYTLQLAPGRVSVNVAAAGYEFATASVTVAPAGTAEQDFTLVEASATLTGAVLDGNTGLGVRHAFVRVDGAGGVQASPDGAYTLSRVPAGLAQVVATAQGYRAETVPVQIVAHDAAERVNDFETAHY
jgi:Carboxypeptidase regulatory-like domain